MIGVGNSFGIEFCGEAYIDICVFVFVVVVFRFRLAVAISTSKQMYVGWSIGRMNIGR